MRGNQGETGFFLSFFTPATLLRAVISPNPVSYPLSSSAKLKLRFLNHSVQGAGGMDLQLRK